MLRINIFYKIAVLAFFSAGLMVLSSGSALAAETNISVGIPGPNDTVGERSANPAGVVANAYQFALMIGGLMAFVMIVYGAVKYTAAGGNSTVQSDAKDRITQALLGLALLVGAAIILSTISPRFSLQGGVFTLPSIPSSQQLKDDSNALFNVGGAGPDGICPSDIGTPAACNALMSPNGGYCHAGSCYNNSNQTGPFPRGGRKS